MAELVKMITDDDGSKIDSPVWCISVPTGDADRTACTGDVFGMGESGAKYKLKDAPLTHITCLRCKRILNWWRELK